MIVLLALVLWTHAAPARPMDFALAALELEVE